MGACVKRAISVHKLNLICNFGLQMDHKIECGLCHSKDNPCVTPCSHSFCRKCIMKWIDDNNPDINCPLDTCEQPFGSFIHSGNRRYVIEMIYPGEAPPKRRLVTRKPAEQRLAGGPAPSDQPPGEGGGSLDGARDDQSSRGSGYGPSGRHGDQRDERGLENLKQINLYCPH